MKIIYYIFFLFLYLNFSAQNKIDLDGCRPKYDSIFKEYFGGKFFDKNIKYNKTKSYIDIFLTNDQENDPEFERIFVNINNVSDIKKYLTQYPKYYSGYYQYRFLYKTFVFYESTYTCETVNNQELLVLEKNEILKYYNKIKSGEYLSPKKIMKIVESEGFKNICYQSLTTSSYYNRDKVVWQIEDCSDNKKIKVIDLDPKNGKILSRLTRYYEKSSRASLWKESDKIDNN